MDSFLLKSNNDGILARLVRIPNVFYPPLLSRPLYMIANVLVPSFVVGTLLGPFCADLIDVHRWAGDDVGALTYVSKGATTRMVCTISNNNILGPHSVSNRYSDGQGWIRIAKSISQIATCRVDDMSTSSNDNFLDNHIMLHTADDTQNIFCK